MDSVHALQSIVLVVVGVLTLCLLKSYIHSRKLRLPPGPLNLPILGSLHLLGSSPHKSLKQLSDKYGELMFLKLGSVPFAVASSASTAKELAHVHGLQFASKRPSIVGEHLGNNFNDIVSSKNTPHMRLLKKIVSTHLLSASRLRLYERARMREQLELARSLYENAGRPVLIREKLHALNMNLVTYMLFGERYHGSSMSMKSEDEDLVAVISEAMSIAGRFNISDYLPSLRWMDIQGIERRSKQLSSTVFRILLATLEEHRSRRNPVAGDEPVCFLDVLLSLEGEEKLSDTSIICLILDVLLGAVDTSAITAEWGFTELVRHPLKLDKARREIEQVVGDSRLVQESDFPQLRYLESIVKETLRLCPVSPLTMPRELESPLTIKGYHIPAGTAAVINMYAISHDQKYWDRPWDFMPERFLESNIDIFGQDFNLIPFGAGRRMCVGTKLGFDLVRLMLATMIQGFDWSLPEGQDPSQLEMKEIFGLVCQKTEALVAVPEPRLSMEVYNRAATQVGIN